jgi:hypothetical protein
MAEKFKKTGIVRDNDFLYYLKDGDVWRAPRKQPGMPKGKPEKVAEVGLEMDYKNYLYFVDKDGDVSRGKRAVGGQKRKKVVKKKAAKKVVSKKKTAKKPAKKKAVKKPAKKKRR